MKLGSLKLFIAEGNRVKETLKKVEKERDSHKAALDAANGQILSLQKRIVFLSREVEELRAYAVKEVDHLKAVIEQERVLSAQKLKETVRRKRIKVTDL